MQSNSWLNRIRDLFPDITFAPSDTFAWNPHTRTVYFGSIDTEKILHELGHALLGHTDFQRDIDLVRMERDAWQKARKVGAALGQSISVDTQEDAMDSYRDWLHARSLCPHCSQSGIQVGRNNYSCLLCSATWHVNDARLCELRRTVTAT